MADALIAPKFSKAIAEKDTNVADLHICLISVRFVRLVQEARSLCDQSRILQHTTAPMGRLQNHPMPW